MESTNKSDHTLADLQQIFPNLKPSTLDYLVREGLIACRRYGRGQLRRYPLEAVEQIKSWFEARSKERSNREQ